jgi:hypothetical protein
MDQPATPSFCALERSKHARMIRAWVLTDDKDGVGFIKVFERDSSLAHTDCFHQRRTTRLVTHVRTIGQIIGAKLADEQLI